MEKEPEKLKAYNANMVGGLYICGRKYRRVSSNNVKVCYNFHFTIKLFDTYFLFY